MSSLKDLRWDSVAIKVYMYQVWTRSEEMCESANIAHLSMLRSLTGLCPHGWDPYRRDTHPNQVWLRSEKMCPSESTNIVHLSMLRTLVALCPLGWYPDSRSTPTKFDCDLRCFSVRALTLYTWGHWRLCFTAGMTAGQAETSIPPFNFVEQWYKSFMQHKDIHIDI